MPDTAAVGTDQGSGGEGVGSSSTVSSITGAPVFEAPQGDTAASDAAAVTPDASTTPGTPDAAGQDAEAAPSGEEVGDLLGVGRELLSPEEYNALKSNPEALHKALNRAFTQKTQVLAPYTNFIKNFNSDPAAATVALAKTLGLDVSDPRTSPARSIQPTIDNAMAKFEEVVGPDAAKAFLPVITDLVKAQLAPLERSVTENRFTLAQEQTKVLLSQFDKEFPDWKQYEPQMMKIAATFQPTDGADGYTVMKYLYKLAKSDQNVADQAAKLVQRVNKSVATSEPRTTPGPRAAATAKRPVTIKEAWEMARRGEVMD